MSFLFTLKWDSNNHISRRLKMGVWSCMGLFMLVHSQWHWPDMEQATVQPEIIQIHYLWFNVYTWIHWYKCIPPSSINPPPPLAGETWPSPLSSRQDGGWATSTSNMHEIQSMTDGVRIISITGLTTANSPWGGLSLPRPSISTAMPYS